MPQKVTFADDIAPSFRQSVRRQAKRRTLRKVSSPKSILKTPTREFPDLPDNWYFPIPCLQTSRKKIPPIKLPGRNCVEVVQNMLFEQINYYNLDIGKVSNNVKKSKDVAADKEREQTDTPIAAARTPLRVTDKRNGNKEIGKRMEQSTQLLPNMPLGRKIVAGDAKDVNVRKSESKETIGTHVLPKPSDHCMLKKRRETIDEQRVTNEHKEHEEKITKMSSGTRLPTIKGKTDKNRTEDRSKKEVLQARGLKLDKKAPKTENDTACLKTKGQKDRIDVMDNTRVSTRMQKNDKRQVIRGTGRTGSKDMKDGGRAQISISSTETKLRRGTSFQAVKEEGPHSTQAKSRRDKSFQAQKEGRLNSTQVKSGRDKSFQAQKEEKPLSPELKPLRGQTASSLLHAMYNNNSILASM